MNEYIASVDGKDFRIDLFPEMVTVDGLELKCEVLEKNPYCYLLRLGNKLYTVTKISEGIEGTGVLIDGNYYSVSVKTKLEAKAAELSENQKSQQLDSVVISPMPGMVVKIRKKVGEQVKKGESLLILEAMKMENDIKSQVDGKIVDILVSEKQSVEKGAKLVLIES